MTALPNPAFISLLFPPNSNIEISFDTASMRRLLLTHRAFLFTSQRKLTSNSFSFCSDFPTESLQLSLQFWYHVLGIEVLVLHVHLS